MGKGRRALLNQEQFRQLQTRLDIPSYCRIIEISKETYATPSAVTRRIINSYFKIVDERAARSKRSTEVRKNGNESEAA